MSWMISRAMMEACANSPSLPGLVAAYSADTCSDGAPSAPLSVMPTRRRFYAKDKMMGYSHRSLCGLTCPRLTATHGRALLRSYLADFHARISAQPEREPASQVADPASGRNLPGLLARFDRATCSWKTPQSSLLAASTLFSGTWPRSGSMRNGACYRQPMLAPRTGAIGCGLWPTPTVHGNYNRAGASPTSGNGLATFVSLFPAPTATNTKAVHMRGADKGKARKSRSYLPTPTCNDAKNSTLPPSQQHRDGMAGYLMRNGEPSGGQLNPDWVEWLMNWPIGWSSLEPMPALDWPTWEREPADVPRVATGIAARVDRLKCIGNGQVPACAAEAWRQLHKRLMEQP